MIVYFSPKGTTKTVTEGVARAAGVSGAVLDLLAEPLGETCEADGTELTVVGMPVYAGRIPGLCRELLSHLKGNGASAVAVAVYGNRDYDDALLELCDLLEESGFHVVGAGAFVAEHSIFPTVGAGRPDEADRAEMAAFGECCAALAAEGAERRPIKVKGNHPYRKAGAVLLKPDGDAACISCGACVKICPTGAILPKTPRKTDGEKCISCGACIRVCPAGARNYHGPAYQVARKGFELKCAARRGSEVFYVSEGKV